MTAASEQGYEAIEGVFTRSEVATFHAAITGTVDRAAHSSSPTRGPQQRRRSFWPYLLGTSSSPIASYPVGRSPTGRIAFAGTW